MTEQGRKTAKSINAGRSDKYVREYGYGKGK
jgi:hypothetical protein